MRKGSSIVKQQTITVSVRLDGKTFWHFMWFDAFILRKRLRRPAAFAAIFAAFALLAFFSGQAQSTLLGTVLLLAGLGLPAVYVGSYLADVHRQAKQANLKARPLVYTVRLDVSGITVTNARKKEEPLRLSWQEVAQAFRMKDCVYLYVTAQKAFLLPEGQADTPDEALWQMLVRNLGAGKCQVHR